MKKNIVVIDDDKDIFQLVNGLLGHYFTLHYFTNGHEGIDFINKNFVDVVLMDEILPDGSGKDFCYQLRHDTQYENGRNIPILMVSHCHKLTDKLMAFSMGVDDYIVKPFEPLELKARIFRRIERLEGGQKALPVKENSEISFQQGDLFLNLSRHKVNISNSTSHKEILLTPTEFKILYLFCQKKEQVISRNQIIEFIWDINHHILDRTIDQHICNIRRKIKESSQTIKAIHGVGYALTDKLVK